MKRLVVIAVLIIGPIAIYVWSMVWGLERVKIGASASSPDGDHVAQFYSLPEGSVTPYGHGVYVHHRLVPVWASSRLVFAAYCGPNEHVHWRTPRELVVTCNVAEGKPKMLPPPKGIVVTHAPNGS